MTDKHQEAINIHFRGISQEPKLTQEQMAREMGVARSTFQEYLRVARSMGLKPRASIKAGIGPVPGKETRIVAIYDRHDTPGHPKEWDKILGEYVAAQQPEYVVNGGDWADFLSLCSHIKNDTITARSKTSFEEDICSLQRSFDAFMEPILKSYTPKFVSVEGNHEHRVHLYEDQHPECENALVKKYHDVLDGFGWTHYSYGEYATIGGVDFTHIPLNIMGRPLGGEMVCRTVGMKSTHDVVFGHCHRFTDYSVPKLGRNRRVRAISAPMAREYGYVPDYVGPNMSGFEWGVLNLTIINGKLERVVCKPSHELQNGNLD